jgi:undecaprenyl-diphosphatase
MYKLIESLDRLDKTIYENIFVYANPPWLSSLSHFLVKSWLLIPLLLIFVFFYTKSQKKNIFYTIILIVLLMGISESLASFFKDLFQRHRPVYQLGIYIFEGAYSFPSAHSVNTMAFAAFWSKRFKESSPYLYSASFIVGSARMLANFHFPGDILGGWAIGFLAGRLFYYLVNAAESKFESRFKPDNSAQKSA